MTVEDAEAARASPRHPLIGDVIAVMDQLYPSTAAMDWDVVGLAVGSPQVPVTKIFFTVDVTAPVVAEAAEAQRGVDHCPPPGAAARYQRGNR